MVVSSRVACAAAATAPNPAGSGQLTPWGKPAAASSRSMTACTRTRITTTPGPSWTVVPWVAVEGCNLRAGEPGEEGRGLTRGGGRVEQIRVQRGARGECVVQHLEQWHSGGRFGKGSAIWASW